MAKTSTQTAIPPPLKALGGWLSAEWFCPSVVSDDDVVGFSLPKFAGGRRQSFRLAERSRSNPGKTAGKQATGMARTRAPNGIEEIIYGIGATCAAAFRRATFLFEPPPTLYFAELPLARLKIRSADTLRRDLIENAFRGCVVHLQSPRAVVMFWPVTETEISNFVGAASPPYSLHEALYPVREAVSRGKDGRLHDENRALIEELNQLRLRIAQLQQSQTALGAMETLGLDDARLKSMLLLLHPDKHGNSEAATEAAKWVNGLRDVLKMRRKE